ncbi:MAG: hypothetical protein ACTSYR_01180 [Candidatus Odinarchaeia archaeon]
MPIKKSLEDIIMILKQNKVDNDKIFNFLIKLGFNQERITKEMMKLSLIDRLPENFQEENKSLSKEKQLDNVVNKLNIILEKLLKIEKIITDSDKVNKIKQINY